MPPAAAAPTRCADAAAHRPESEGDGPTGGRPLCFSRRSPYTRRVPALSVTIITFNEAAHVAAAIASVAWADEIVVVDSGSTDGTLDIARQLATRVEVREWP